MAREDLAFEEATIPGIGDDEANVYWAGLRFEDVPVETYNKVIAATNTRSDNSRSAQIRARMDKMRPGDSFAIKQEIEPSNASYLTTVIKEYAKKKGWEEIELNGMVLPRVKVHVVPQGNNMRRMIVVRPKREDIYLLGKPAKS